jgi:hypothetical protein
MSIKSKINLKPNGIKSAKKVGIFSAFTATITGAVQKVFLIAMRMAGKKKMGATALPESTWHLGDSAGIGGMIAALDDKRLQNIFDSDLPLDDNTIPPFTDVHDETYKLNPLVSSKDIFTDYWVEYGSDQPDPYNASGTGHAVP